MKNKLFGKNVPPACSYCEKGTLSKDGQRVLCKRKGVMHPLAKCRRYKYDPLRRKPAVDPPLPRYAQEDFSLQQKPEE